MVKRTAATVAEMTIPEFKALIRETVVEVLQELLGDPDAGLPLRPEFEERLRRSMEYVASGGKLLSFKELVEALEKGE